MIQTNWYVITGAPSSGKTTLINELEGLGYTISPEVARTYIKNLLMHHQSIEEIHHNILELQRKILAIMLERERCLSTKELIFFDRGTPDSIAYFRFHGLDERHLVQSCQHYRYKSIFYCHGLPVVHDAIRREDEESARKIGEYIYQAYIDLGYNLIELPPISVEERIKIILSHIKIDQAVL